MNLKKILYSMLKEIKYGNKVHFEDYNISKEDFGRIVEYAKEKNYIENALVIRSDWENKVTAISITDARITFEGENYLSENNILDKGYKGLKEIDNWLKEN